MTCRKRLSSLLVKPAGPDCNLRCEYCFYREKDALFGRGRRHAMTEETLEAVYRRLSALEGDVFSVTWQGGEPTLMGLPFYETALQLHARLAPDRMVDYGFQTNGVLLDASWAEFFRRHAFLIGLSLDGPEHVHDRYRRDAEGRGTFHTVYDRAKMLLDHGVQVNATVCVNDDSVDHVEEVYQFHKELGLTYMQFIPIVEPCREDPSRNATYSVPAEKYGDFLCKLFDLWLADFRGGAPTTSIRNFESIFFNYAGLECPECTYQEECGGYLVIEHNGNVYPCDFFVEESLLLGNVHQDDLSELLNSEKQRAFGAAKRPQHEACRACRWLHMCYGGCVKDRVRNVADPTRPYFCEAYQKFYDHALSEDDAPDEANDEPNEQNA